MKRKAKKIMNLGRLRMWNAGKRVKPSERTLCNACSARTGIREFEYGYFCIGCFEKSEQCSTPGCENLAVKDPKFDTEGRCRCCEFDYDGELEVYPESDLSTATDYAHTKDIHTKEFRSGINASMKRIGVKTVDPRKEWFVNGG